MDIQHYLSEGISFFKDSKRLRKIADKIEKTSKYSSAEVGIVTSKLRGIANIFADLEEKYKNSLNASERQKLKQDYEAAKTKYISFIRLINKESFLKALKAAIDLGIVGAAIFIGYKNIEIFSDPKYKENGGEWKDLPQRDDSAKITLPNIKKEVQIQKMVNGALMGVTTATAIGFTMLFKKIFFNKGDELYNQTRQALFNLEKAEKMENVKNVEKEE